METVGSAGIPKNEPQGLQPSSITRWSPSVVPADAGDAGDFGTSSSGTPHCGDLRPKSVPLGGAGPHLYHVGKMAI